MINNNYIILNNYNNNKNKTTIMDFDTMGIELVCCHSIVMNVIVFYFPSEFSFLFLFVSQLPDTVYELYLGTWHSNIQHTLGQPALHRENGY